jgi:hypothetical protein
MLTSAHDGSPAQRPPRPSSILGQVVGAILVDAAAAGGAGCDGPAWPVNDGHECGGVAATITPALWLVPRPAAIAGWRRRDALLPAAVVIPTVVRAALVKVIALVAAMVTLGGRSGRGPAGWPTTSEDAAGVRHVAPTIVASEPLAVAAWAASAPRAIAESTVRLGRGDDPEAARSARTRAAVVVARGPDAAAVAVAPVAPHAYRVAMPGLVAVEEVLTGVWRVVGAKRGDAGSTLAVTTGAALFLIVVEACLVTVSRPLRERRDVHVASDARVRDTAAPRRCRRQFVYRSGAPAAAWDIARSRGGWALAREPARGFPPALPGAIPPSEPCSFDGPAKMLSELDSGGVGDVRRANLPARSAEEAHATLASGDESKDLFPLTPPSGGEA